jgi:MarR family transcriptional regulator, organic hydroperoxide resistance regulator
VTRLQCALICLIKLPMRHSATMDEVASLLDHYPRIYFACHVRHRREPESGKMLSERQASILDHLDEGDPMALKELARHLGVTAATMCVAVDRLVDGGWVRRDRDPGDGRRVCLRLTAAGVRMKAAQTVLDPDRVRRVLSRLTPDERAEALAGLALLARASSEETASRTQGGS